jgi:hypothetical protein
MKFLWLLCLLLGQSLLAHTSYQLEGAENDSYRDFTLEEFTSRIGPNQWLMPYYACNGRDELDPFHLPVRNNPRKDSLRIRAYNSDEMITYREGLFYNQQGRPVKKFSDPMFQHAQRALERFEKMPATSRLLRLLETSYFPLTIRFGGDRFDPNVTHGEFTPGIYMAQAIMFFVRGRMPDDIIIFNNIGVGGDIHWHPQGKFKATEEDAVERETDPLVTLAHEMFHALDSIRGLIDFRMVQGQQYESQMVAEYRAVYFENIVRKEMGYRYRKYYSAKQGPGMLDETGSPYLIPAPCLSSF